jgi:hypothetical protein
MSVLAAFDIQAIVEWIADHIGPIFIAVVFFVLPILRGLKEQSRKKQQLEEEARRRAEVHGPEDEGEAHDGRKAWEALMRGEEPARSAPPVFEPPPLVRPAPPPRRMAEEGEREPALAGRLSDFAEAPTADEEELAVDEESFAREQNDRLLREEMQRRADFLAREKELAARKTVAPDGLVSIEPAESAPTVSVARPRSAALTGLASGRRDELRRALVAREILGPPVALREHADALGPTALSR